MAKSNNLFEDALAAEGITGQLADVARSIYKQESGGGKNTKTSNAGAVGGMQILPATFASVADKGWDINDPLLNARAGIRYLKQLDKLAGGNPALTAAGYYGGPGGLEKARKGIAVADPRNPKAPNTLEYGQQVVARLPGNKRAAPVAVAQVPAAQEPVVAAPVPADTGAARMSELPAPAVQEAVPVAGPDAWQEFVSKFREAAPVQAEDLQYGAKQVAAPIIPVTVPDFMATVVPAAKRQIDMSSFMGWGARQT